VASEARERKEGNGGRSNIGEVALGSQRSHVVVLQKAMVKCAELVQERRTKIEKAKLRPGGEKKRRPDVRQLTKKRKKAKRKPLKRKLPKTA